MSKPNGKQQYLITYSGKFKKALAQDLATLQRMIDVDELESGIHRIGAEQEMFLVDTALDPAPIAEEVLRRIGSPLFQFEIGLFNLEANLPESILSEGCFGAMEKALTDLLAVGERAAREVEASLVLTGVLPTIRISDLCFDHLTPDIRYRRISDVLSELHNGAFDIDLTGADRLRMTHDNLMVLACCSSFQIHLQVSASEFVPFYNWAQALTGPVLAAAASSPIFLGRRLWAETRLPLIQQVINGHSEARFERITFGDRWLEESVLELFCESATRFDPIFVVPVNTEPTHDDDDVPRLRNLCIHNGYIWRWNRPYYGITKNRPHLRIEMRALPSGPTVADEVANTAFLTGLIFGSAERYGAVNQLLSFQAAKENFVAAQRHGLQAELKWINGGRYVASTLVLEKLLLLARDGLSALGIITKDIDTYLGIIEKRVRTGQTGAQWISSALTVSPNEPSESRCRRLTAVMLAHQRKGEPVHCWPPFEPK